MLTKWRETDIMTDTTKIDNDIDALTSELKQLRSDFSRLGDLLQSTLRHAGKSAAAEASAAGEKVWSDAKVKADEVAKAIQGEPFAFTFGAFAAGLLLGWIFSSRR
jgi:ElaB/YqjD/DUF883 family membrane-anchored ribosome-binding protein